jgi:RHS repeat-associated protein
MIVAHKAGEDPTHLYIDNYALRQNWVTTLNCDPNNPNNTFAQERRYRFGFNGMEMDNSVRGFGNALEFGGRSIYDPRLGKFISVDPWVRKFPDLSPYQIANNTPIWAIDLDGLGWIIYTYYQVSKKQISGTNHRYIFEKMKYPDGKVMTAAVEKPEVSGTIFNNWYIYEDKLYQYPYEIPGYTASVKAQRERTLSIVKNALIIGGGVAVTISSFGTGTPAYSALLGITSGTFAITGGSVKMGLDLKGNEGDKELSNKIPTGLIDGLVGVPLEGIATIKFGDEEVGRNIRFATQIADGILDLRGLFDTIENTPDLIDKSFTITNITIEAVDKTSERKDDTK